MKRMSAKPDSSMLLARFLATGGSVTRVAESKSSKPRKTQKPEVDMAALPPELRAKFANRI